MDGASAILVVILAFCSPTMGKKRGRIVGGRFAEKGEFPFMVGLSYRPHTVSCGGTILSAWHVLTACHCVIIVKNQSTSIEIRDSGNARIIAGSLSRNVPEEQGYQVRNVHYWRHHPNCEYLKTKEVKLDIAMIKLTQPFILNFLVQPVYFPRNITVWRGLVNRMQLGNSSCTTVGWGVTVVFHDPSDGKEQISNPAKYLKALDVNLTDIWWCFYFVCDFSHPCMERMLDQYLHGTQDKICADAKTSHNGTVCSGDSGSPLICNGVLTDFGLSDSVQEVNFYVVSRGEALHYEKVKGSLGETRGFRQVSNSPLIPIVVLLHGLESSYDSECNKKIAEGLLDRKGMNNVNIIAVEYPATAGGRGYDRAVRSTDDIGKEVGDFLLSSQTDGSLSLATTTLIGFSLGAHVAGVAGYRIRENSGYLRRIIGLDPAKPAFINLPLESRLDRSDAGFVSVIHTADGFLGMEEAIGHADFYPNGGKEVQPRCQGNGLHSLICSHTAACDYLAESIRRPSSFIAEKCSSWENYQLGRCRSHEKAFMGFDTDDKVEGVYFLKTHPESSGGAAFEVVDVNTLSETDEDRILSQYHWYPRSGASPAFPLPSILFPSCLLLLLRLYVHDK